MCSNRSLETRACSYSEFGCGQAAQTGIDIIQWQARKKYRISL